MTIGHNIIAEKEESGGRALNRTKDSSLSGLMRAMSETSDVERRGMICTVAPSKASR